MSEAIGRREVRQTSKKYTTLSLYLVDIWRRQDKTRGRLGHLVQSHCHLVSLVRETEAIFGPMLQCYYASTVSIRR